MYLEYNMDIGVGWAQSRDLGDAADLGCTRLRRLSLGKGLVHVSHVLLLGAVGQPRDVLIMMREAQEKKPNAANTFKPLATSHWLPVNIPWPK